MKKIIKIVFVIIGTIIGAGFASGKEIATFFYKYGDYGILGIVLASILIGYVIYKTMLKSEKIGLNNYSDMKINTAIKIAVTAFLLCSFHIMVAGFAAFLRQEFNIPIFLGALIISLFCYFILKNKIEGIIKINELIIPVLIFFLFIIFFKNINFLEINKLDFNITKKFFVGEWIISSILYVGYNSIILFPILINLKNKLENNKEIKNKYLNNQKIINNKNIKCKKTLKKSTKEKIKINININIKKEVLFISVFSAIIFFILALGNFLMLNKGNEFVLNLEVPISIIVKQQGNIYQNIFAGIIIISIYTTAISAGYSFLKNITKTENAYNKYLLYICVSSIFVSNIGFSFLIELLYPLFGIIGWIQIFYLIAKRD